MNGLTAVVEYLTSIPAWYLATCEGDRPHVRPFSFAAEQDERLVFVTSTKKDVYRELTNNPHLEASAWNPGHGWLIVRGVANFDIEVCGSVRTEGFNHLVGLGEHWSDENDPCLAFFAVDDLEVWRCDIDGSWNPVVP